jgi:hypothetical protein
MLQTEIKKAPEKFPELQFLFLSFGEVRRGFF